MTEVKTLARNFLMLPAATKFSELKQQGVEDAVNVLPLGRKSRNSCPDQDVVHQFQPY
jgi:hypothetical protein